VLGVAAFFLLPAIAVTFLAFTDWNLLGTPAWAGLSNLLAVATSDSTIRAIAVTIAIGATSVVVEITWGLALAKALVASRRTGFARAILLIPWMAAPITVGVIARWVLAPSDGLLAGLLGHRIDLLVDPLGAPLAVAAVVAWQATGFAALVYAAALQAIPSELRAAAALDGAGGWGVLRGVEWPLLRPITFFLLVTATIRSFALYDLIVPLTGGGPDGATLTASALIVREAWESFDVGRAAALACVVTVVELVVVAAQWAWYRRRSI
jgi:multiple sugar transport system permease protein